MSIRSTAYTSLARRDLDRMASNIHGRTVEALVSPFESPVGDASCALAAFDLFDNGYRDPRKSGAFRLAMLCDRHGTDEPCAIYKMPLAYSGTLQAYREAWLSYILRAPSGSRPALPVLVPPFTIYEVEGGPYGVTPVLATIYLPSPVTGSRLTAASSGLRQSARRGVKTPWGDVVTSDNHPGNFRLDTHGRVYASDLGLWDLETDPWCDPCHTHHPVGISWCYATNPHPVPGPSSLSPLTPLMSGAVWCTPCGLFHTA